MHFLALKVVRNLSNRARKKGGEVGIIADLSGTF